MQTPQEPYFIEYWLVYRDESRPFEDAAYFSSYHGEVGTARTTGERISANSRILQAFLPFVEEKLFFYENVLRPEPPELTGPLRVENGAILREGVIEGPNRSKLFFPVSEIDLYNFLNEVRETAIEQSLLRRVEQLLGNYELGIDCLDLQLVPESAMKPSGAHRRRDLVEPCTKDYTFWSSVFTNSLFLNKAAGKFDTPTRTVYPQAVTLFEETESEFRNL